MNPAEPDITFEPKFALDSPEVQKLLELWGFTWAWIPGIQYVVRPDHRQYYALTPATIERWTLHLRNCMEGDGTEIFQNVNPRIA